MDGTRSWWTAGATSTSTAPGSTSCALEPRVVLDADTGQHRDLFASQAGDTTVAAVGGQRGLLRGDLRSPRDQEVADVVPAVHASNATSVHAQVGRPCRYPSRPLDRRDLVTPAAPDGQRHAEAR